MVRISRGPYTAFPQRHSARFVRFAVPLAILVIFCVSSLQVGVRGSVSLKHQQQQQQQQQQQSLRNTENSNTLKKPSDTNKQEEEKVSRQLEESDSFDEDRLSA